MGIYVENCEGISMNVNLGQSASVSQRVPFILDLFIHSLIPDMHHVLGFLPIPFFFQTLIKSDGPGVNLKPIDCDVGFGMLIGQ